MITSHPYPYRHPTADEIEDLTRRARVERARAVRSFFLALFRRQPAATKTENEPSLCPANAAH
jgi:hypothetical protein